MDMSTSCVVCGTKSQDYTVECYCCGNFYCSDKCKVQDHQKKIFHHHAWMDYRKIYEDILTIDENIRFVTIFDVNGKIRYSDHRQGIENLLTQEESKKSLKLALDGWRIRSELAPKIGKGKYVLAEYENIKRITMPLGNSHLLYVTTNVKADHSKIISGITNIARQKQDY
jgi:hypothetical protein